MPADHDGPRTITVKANRDEQKALLDRGEPFFFPAYVGSKGWIGIDLQASRLDWTEVEELVRESYRAIAPKRLADQVP